MDAKIAADARTQRRLIMEEKRKRIRKPGEDEGELANKRRMPLRDITYDSNIAIPGNLSIGELRHNHKVNPEPNTIKESSPQMKPKFYCNGRIVQDQGHDKENKTFKGSQKAFDEENTPSLNKNGGSNLTINEYTSAEGLSVRSKKDIASEARRKRILKIGQKRLHFATNTPSGSRTATYISSRTSTVTDPVINLNFSREDAHIGTVSEVNPEGITPHVIDQRKKARVERMQKLGEKKLSMALPTIEGSGSGGIKEGKSRKNKNKSATATRWSSDDGRVVEVNPIGYSTHALGSSSRGIREGKSIRKKKKSVTATRGSSHGKMIASLLSS
ncbi:hypothetical protein PIB30_095777 [Stylosanthes scabra]|uniref:Uncharacterized protein n=1 Tax=Stylosanthes scabra TaxID=79078 RepID=A0ABU6XSJ2_9FABA|nr:hypothetical protein [Stylosanthes scabra]